MGSKRVDDYQYAGKGFLPKVTWVGSLDAACSGRKTSIEIGADRVLFKIADLKSVLFWREVPIPQPRLLIWMLNLAELKLYAQIGQRKPIELFPKPNWIVRWSSPAVRELLRARLITH